MSEDAIRERLQQNIIQYAGQVPSGLDDVVSYFKPLTPKRGDFILREGEVCKSVFFIVEGCVQVFVVDRQGNESTREFYIEDQWVTDIFGFQNQTPSKEFIRCVEPCQLLQISHSDFSLLSTNFKTFAEVYRKILEVSYNNTVYRVNTLTSMDGLDRVRWLMENKPKLMSRLSGRLLASYLGLSPETLTRLKAKL